MRKVSICQKTGMRRGAWSPEEDERLSSYIKRYGHWNWRELPKFAGLLRCGKSCRLRWMNYLRPNIKRGNFTKEEDEIIIDFIQKLGNRWSVIAANLPGRTDNEIKNHWHTHLRDRTKQNSIPKKLKQKNVKCETESKKGLDSGLPISLILRSSDHPAIPESLRKSSYMEASVIESQVIKYEIAVSSNSAEEFDGNFCTKPFFMEDKQNLEDNSSISSDASPCPHKDALLFYDLLDGCNMEAFFNNYLPSKLEDL